MHTRTYIHQHATRYSNKGMWQRRAAAATSQRISTAAGTAGTAGRRSWLPFGRNRMGRGAIRSNSTGSVKQNLVEKIVQRHVTPASATAVRSGDFVSVAPAFVMTHDNTAAVMQKFDELGADHFFNPHQAVFTLDHNVQDKSEKNLAKYRAIEAFAAKHGVTFFPAGRGIGHQVMCEEGFVFPNRMVVASDSHSNMYGGLGCLGTPIVRTDAAGIWATGQTWWQIPPVAKVVLSGKLRPGVTGKDVIVTLCGAFNHDEVLNHAVEFSGDGIASLSIDERLTIANMTTEWGALAGVFPADAAVADWYTRRYEASVRRKSAFHTRVTRQNLESIGNDEGLAADSGAHYAKVLTLDLATVEPHVSGPNSVKVMHSLADMARRKQPVHKAYLVSCVNSRAEDIARAAAVVRGKKIAQGVEMYVAPASTEVLEESERSGDWQALLAAGAVPLPAGCGPCIGLGQGLLKDGEVGISATNRNFKGRMGSPNAEAYLASPEIVAASAIAGFITGPEAFIMSNSGQPLSAHIEECEQPPTEAAHVAGEQRPLLEGFPDRISGRIVLCADDNINTDGIYAGKYTYREDIDPQQQAQVVMENYDTSFVSNVRRGDVLVTGFNFGTGSSREQAATALKHAGVSLVLSGSVSETYKRNALNNGLLVLEVPALVTDMKAYVRLEPNTAVFMADTIDVDFAQCCVRWNGRAYACSPVGRIAQELVVAGGLKNWIAQRQL
ncbi:homoacontiase [Salpingoeca rosetta]|uniref:Homoaconitase, mitochondrial n=1 Tax=Salpingoeca rosetta (strain ATCC 50818 / BSB-021) TaxID=946362 RepID=F2ULJ3_SALR5|nr:homoacontiase [Salpingoeca rosetta]EGD77992.1 homoacontiase [Salpingoeca rosetta]|eukprot:XP_004990054.1 homoacontiase [Salpingoeca rosetta]